jgi:Tol biopolymer transport system component/DNA-binding winged helix-turn-helix (wHTH) protein
VLETRPTPGVVRFGSFEVDVRAGEVRKHGHRIRLQDQPFRILQVLLEHAGEVVTREELQRQIWPSDTFVDFDRGLNNAVKRLREALGDSAEHPRFIETLPRRGYRFIGTVTPIPAVPSASAEFGQTGPAPLAPVQQSTRTEHAPNWLKIAVGILLGTVTIAFLFVFLRMKPTATLSALALVPFTTLPGLEVAPTFSPDGKHIAFAWSGDPAPGSNGFDLYIKAVGSENLFRLTHHPSEWITPAWSPDGTQIAFYRISGEDTGLYLVPAQGGPERKLRPAKRSNMLFIKGLATTISWSPDGKWIAYVDSLPSTVNLFSVESLESTPLSPAVGCIQEGLPAFSNRGDQLAYICALDSFENRIYVFTLHDGTQKLVTKFSGLQSGIAWTGDDSRLILALDQSGGSELLEIALANGSIQKLLIGQDAAWPAISRKGDRLAFTSSFNTINIWRKDLMHPASAGVKLLTSTREQTNPTYSPDGKHIAFESTRGGVQEVWVSDSDGTNLVQVSRLSNYATGTPRWSPDSTKLVFDSWYTGHPQVFVVDLPELIPHKLVTNISGMFQPSWSHDGKWIYFLSFVGEAPRVYRCPENGGNATLLSFGPAFGLHEAFDGETLYFADSWNNGRLWKVSSNQYAQASAVESMPLLKDASLWTVVPGGIYFVPADMPYSICYFDFSARKVRRVTNVARDFNSGNGGLSVSPDGHWLLYSQVDEVNSDIMLVDHFH